MMIAGHTLQDREIWRPAEGGSDGMGGQTDLPPEMVAVEKFKIDEASATERMASGQFEAVHTNNAYADPQVDVRRGDELRAAGQPVLRVFAVTRPSKPVYVKALCEQRDYAEVD